MGEVEGDPEEQLGGEFGASNMHKIWKLRNMKRALEADRVHLSPGFDHCIERNLIPGRESPEKLLISKDFRWGF